MALHVFRLRLSQKFFKFCSLLSQTDRFSVISSFYDIMASYDHVNESPPMRHHVELCMYEMYVEPLVMCIS